MKRVRDIVPEEELDERHKLAIKEGTLRTLRLDNEYKEDGTKLIRFCCTEKWNKLNIELRKLYIKQDRTDEDKKRENYLRYLLFNR